MTSIARLHASHQVFIFSKMAVPPQQLLRLSPEEQDDFLARHLSRAEESRFLALSDEDRQAHLLDKCLQIQEELARVRQEMGAGNNVAMQPVAPDARRTREANPSRRGRYANTQ